MIPMRIGDEAINRKKEYLFTKCLMKIIILKKHQSKLVILQVVSRVFD
jgi:hypothetical protein